MNICVYVSVCVYVQNINVILQLMGKYMLYLDNILKIIFRSYFKRFQIKYLMKKIHRYNCLPVKEVLFSY